MLILQGGVRLLLNGQLLAQLQSQSFNDIELICTGKEIKWISLSQSFKANQFVFVDAPEEAGDVNIENLCPDDVFTDTKKSLITQQNNLDVQFASFFAHVSALAKRPHTAYPYQKALSRAPPIFS